MKPNCSSCDWSVECNRKSATRRVCRNYERTIETIETDEAEEDD